MHHGLQASPLHDPLPVSEASLRGSVRGAEMRLEMPQAPVSEAQMRAGLREPQLQASGAVLPVRGRDHGSHPRLPLLQGNREKPLMLPLWKLING